MTSTLILTFCSLATHLCTQVHVTDVPTSVCESRAPIVAAAVYNKRPNLEGLKLLKMECKPNGVGI